MILFGRNVASYKFALGQTLLELHSSPGDLIKLDELALPYFKQICEHLRSAPKQATSASSRFLDACRKANAGDMTDDDLCAVTVFIGFNNVIDAFHRLGPRDISRRFFIDERTTNAGIRLTDDLRALGLVDLGHETVARWRLVETAGELSLTRSLISFDPVSEELTTMRSSRRTKVTSARPALNGYQKGHCFYCYAAISLGGAVNPADVDHFFPWSLRHALAADVNGVWNLVLACKDCNRGKAGKSDLAPELPLLARLHMRNEFLITSHHPLRETLMLQTGALEPERRRFLQARYGEAVVSRVARWGPTPRGPAVF